ncbi:MAG: hypothetical protein M3535_06640 [Actinomycetota bacterium]|jgi:hypothetical protein|nr:hypothetical protein [Actinomycetota bacterium]MDQ3354493.1 hypothetical protein [Actinomycetota bacterium]
MRFRLGYVLGFGTGYYLGTRAGRARYDQLNRLLAKARRSDAYEAASDKAKDLVDDGVERARDYVEERRSTTDDDTTDDLTTDDVIAGVVVSDGAGLIVDEPLDGEPLVDESLDPALHDLSPGPPPAGSLSEDPRPGGPGAP